MCILLHFLSVTAKVDTRQLSKMPHTLIVINSQTVHLPHMFKPLSIIGVSIWICVDAMTFSYILHPGSWCADRLLKKKNTRNWIPLVQWLSCDLEIGRPLSAVLIKQITENSLFSLTKANENLMLPFCFCLCHCVEIVWHNP